MKYTINGYSQEKLIEYGVDLSSSLILRVIADMYTGNSKKIEYKIIEDDKYMWCTYDYLIEQIPILGTERTLIRKIESLIEKKILKKKILSQKKGRTGRYLYISLGENYDSLTEYKTNDKKSVEESLINTNDKMSLEQMTNCPETNDKMSFDQMTKCHNKDSSITNSSIKDTTTSESENLSQETAAKDNPRENSSSSFSSEKDLIKDILYQHGLDKPTIDNILKLEKVTVARAKIVLNYAIAQKWNAGAIYLAFKENWNCDNFSSSKMTVETALTEPEARKKIKERANYWLDYYEMTGNYQYCKLSLSNDLKKYPGFENICQEYLKKFESFCKNR